MPTLDRAALAVIASQMDWSKTISALSNSRAGDTWMPLFQVAEYCNDIEWIKYAASEFAKAIVSLKEGQGDEPNQIIVSKLVSLAIEPNTLHVKHRVLLKDITKGLKDDGHNLNSWQVGKILKDQGFQKKLSGGNEYVYIDKAHLLGVAKQLGIDDDVLKQMTP